MTQQRGFPPTIRELCAALDVNSTNGMNDHLVILVRKQCVTRERMSARSLLVTSTGRAALALKLKELTS